MTSGRERDAQRTRVHIADRRICHHCKRPGLDPQNTFCPDCSFPQGGTEREQYAFIVKKRRVLSEIKDNEKMLWYGKYMLWFVAGLNVFSFGNQKGVLLGGGLLVSLVFVALSFWVRRNPFATFLTALIVYASLQGFFALFDVRFILQGLLFKFFIVGTFAYGMYSGKYIERLKKEL